MMQIKRDNPIKKSRNELKISLIWVAQNPNKFVKSFFSMTHFLRAFNFSPTCFLWTFWARPEPIRPANISNSNFSSQLKILNL